MPPTPPTDLKAPNTNRFWTAYMNLRRQPWFLHRRIALLVLLAVFVPSLAISFHTGDGTRTVLRVVAVAAFALFVIVGLTIRRRYSSIAAFAKPSSRPTGRSSH
jgi:protein-S-isoprenylcysteine O-methyltransferase Ste14